MNNLLLIKERIKRAERLSQAQVAAKKWNAYFLYALRL